jgi:hypothetical protein
MARDEEKELMAYSAWVGHQQRCPHCGQFIYSEGTGNLMCLCYQGTVLFKEWRAMMVRKK